MTLNKYGFTISQVGEKVEKIGPGSCKSSIIFFIILLCQQEQQVYTMANRVTLISSILGSSFLLLVLLAELGAAQYPAMPFATKRAGKKKQPWNDGHDKENDLLVTKKAFFDIAIDDEEIGRIVIGLFGETCPVTVQNFAALTRGNFKNDVSRLL